MGEDEGRTGPDPTRAEQILARLEERRADVEAEVQGLRRELDALGRREAELRSEIATGSHSPRLIHR